MSTHLLTPAALVAALLAPIPVANAQSAAWKVPEAGAVEYQRTTSMRICPPAEVGRGGVRVILLGSFGGASWRYRAGAASPDESFASLTFDDSGWAGGRTPFSSDAGSTRWADADRFLEARHRFDLGRRSPRAAVLTVRHDDRCRIWLNGQLIYRADTWTPEARHVQLEDRVVDLFVRGENLLAVQVENTGGVGRFDLALTTFDRSFPEPGAAAKLVERDDDGANSLSASLLSEFRAPPILCEGQLDPDHLFVEMPPIDVRDLGAWFAFDLRRIDVGTAITSTVPRTWRFGDLQVRGRADAPASDGSQKVALQIRSSPPSPRGDDRRYLDAFVTPHHTHDLEGSLTVVRTYDPDRGIVASLDSRLEAELRVHRGASSDVPFRLLVEDSWRVQQVRSNRDAEFQTAVTDAIARSRNWLVKQLENPSQPATRGGVSQNRTYGTGRLALALLAAVHGELPRDHPVLVKGFDELRKRTLLDTYATAHAIMALEAFYAPRGEIEDLRAGTIDRPHQRRPSDADRALLEGWRDILLRNVDSRADRGYVLRFNYVPGRRFDNSVDQYALLGLYSAHLCGVEVSPSVWNAAANHLIETQSAPTGTRPLTLTTYRQLEELRAGRTTTALARETRVAGWGYQDPKVNGVERPIYGAMTCAGISGLTICLAGLRDAGVTRASLSGAADQAIRQGFAWLAENFTVHSHAGRVHGQFSWTYYYLYGLERACELSGIARIDRRDWYLEGALTLLALQETDGSWPTRGTLDDRIEQTAMALLFLKQASLPVLTGR